MSETPQYRWEVRNEIRMAQTADMMARECREADDDSPPRRASDATTYRKLAFQHRKTARELLSE